MRWQTSVCLRLEEETYFRQMARHPRFYDLIWKSIAPAIYGNLKSFLSEALLCKNSSFSPIGHNDIKKAIACLLFGGSRKSLPDGMRLRGDINVLLLVGFIPH